MHANSRLTPLQTRILGILAGLQPPWTLSGGGALAGYHLGHRTTRDLDLFWHGRHELGPSADAVLERLCDAQLDFKLLQRAKGFARIQAGDGTENVVIDLVAEPVPCVDAPVPAAAGGRPIQIDSRHEILVNKLGALLHRSELRDLIDIEALLNSGGDLKSAIAGAGSKDGGFSPVSAGWALQSFPVEVQARVHGLPAAESARLLAFRDELARRIAALARP